eukprot:7109696-Prymnesium_polylepis.2
MIYLVQSAWYAARSATSKNHQNHPYRMVGGSPPRIARPPAGYAPAGAAARGRLQPRLSWRLGVCLGDS